MDSEFDKALLDVYTDEQVVYYVNQSPTLTTTRTESIHVLSHGLVAKSIPWPEDYRDETDAMDMARAIGIHVPAVHRIISLPEGDHLIIMERIHGKTLEQLWPSLGWWTTIRIAWQLRSFISALRTVTSQQTGGLHSGRVHSEWIQGIHGPVPHASPAQFCAYLNWWLIKARPSNCQPLGHLVLSPPREHVLVHQDLAPRNMILDLDGRLWLVDWGRSGYYPAFMEYLGMEGLERTMPWLAVQNLASWWGRCRWSLFRLIACGYARLHAQGGSALAVVRQRSLRYKLEKPVHSVRY